VREIGSPALGGQEGRAVRPGPPWLAGAGRVRAIGGREEESGQNARITAWGRMPQPRVILPFASHLADDVCDKWRQHGQGSVNNPISLGPCFAPRPQIAD